jgi:hypothetical protein
VIVVDEGQFYSARFIGGGNRSSLKKTTDLPQVTDNLYHVEITLVLIPINNSQATVKHKYLHLLIYYLSGYFRRGVNFAIFSQTVRDITRTS